MKEFAYRWGGLEDPQIRIDNDFIDSCRNVVMGTNSAVHTLEQAWVDHVGRGSASTMMVARRYIKVSLTGGGVDIGVVWLGAAAD